MVMMPGVKRDDHRREARPIHIFKPKIELPFCSTDHKLAGNDGNFLGLRHWIYYSSYCFGLTGWLRLILTPGL